LNIVFFSSFGAGLGFARFGGSSGTKPKLPTTTLSAVLTNLSDDIKVELLELSFLW
jgi:hypothetical protein